MRFVLDASAVRALLHGETAAQDVQAVVEEATLSAVNWSEVCQRSLARRVDTEGLRADVEALGLRIEPFLAEDAEVAAGFWRTGRQLGLSLGDRACLALARRLGATALTADRAWARLELGVEVRTIR